MINTFRASVCAVIFLFTLAVEAKSQSEYRNIEGGRPVRVSDASPTELHGLDLDLTTVRVDKLSFGRYRLQVEPRVSYGVFPRTDISIRALGFYREPSAIPRGTVAGVGVGGEYQLKLESLNLPALALAGEVWFPTGPAASVPAYSVKALATRSFPIGRLHLNAAYGTYSIKIPAPPPGGSTLIPPIIDAPCTVSPSDGGLNLRASCSAPISLSSNAASAALKPGNNTDKRWLLGAAVDHALPLQSVLLVAGVFAERFEGLGRPTDWTADGGIRKQLSTRLVADIGVGRKFSGLTPSWFATFGTSFSLAFRK
jgi:hypothetical protein